MESNQHFSMTTFTETTKKVCTCSAASLILIILFIISPLSNLFLISPIMKVIILAILFYTMFLNIKQTNYLRTTSDITMSNEVSSQMTMNIVCSYIFTLFIGLLIIFVIKSFF